MILKPYRNIIANYQKINVLSIPHNHAGYKQKLPHKIEPPKPSKNASSNGGNRKVEHYHNTLHKNVLSRILLSKSGRIMTTKKPDKTKIVQIWGDILDQDSTSVPNIPLPYRSQNKTWD